MKTAEMYMKEAEDRDYGIVSTEPYLSEDIPRVVVLDAIRACLRDRDKFAEEMLTKVNKINQELIEMNQTIDRINSLLAASSPG